MLKLQLFGSPSIRDAAEIYLPSQKAQALLYFLAAEHERSFARGQLIAMLWEESSEREGRNSLSTVLSRLRQALPTLPLRIEGDTIAWQPAPDVEVDLHEMQAALREQRSAIGEPAPAAAGRLEEAVRLYRGPLLDGFGLRDSESYDEWLRLERERWQQRWLNAVEQLVERYTLQGRWAIAIEYARRAVAVDPLQERFHRALMSLHYHAGDRAAALGQFRTCRELLERELGVEPDVETVGLYRAIADGRLQRLSSPAPTARAAPALEAPPQRPAQRLAARLESARRRSFVGRAGELGQFEQMLAEELPPYAVVYVYGPGGVGKSTLLGEFLRLCGEAGVAAIPLDARNIQPTPDGMLGALRQATGADDPLAALPERHVLLIDTFELLAPLEGWLRDQFLPQLPERAMVVLAGRNALSSGWRVDPGWQEITHVVQLGNLSEAEASDYLERRNISPAQRAGVLRFTRCYPLALSLAAEVLLQRPGSTFGDIASQDIIRVLLERFVAGVPSPAHRAALEACAEVRVLSEPLLAAMLDVPDPRELFDWLRDLSFVSVGPRGIFPHDLAREALSADLRWRNPPWRQELHRRARGAYMAEFARTSSQDQYLALLDLIFLHDSPLLRSIFTWNDIGGLVEDTPRAFDWPALIEMVRRHEGDESAAIAAGWFARQPEGTIVFRDVEGAITGFLMYIVLRPEDADQMAADPVTATIAAHLARSALPEGSVAMVGRFWMDRESYQAVSPTQGMIFVTAIRVVLTIPRLARSFHVFHDAEAWTPAMGHVLFARAPELEATVGGRRFGVFVRDWESQPPYDWLEALAAGEVQ